MPKSICACVTFVAIVFTTDSPAEPKSSAPEPRPITLGELNSRGVVGMLGVPLGKIVEVTGVVVENRLKSMKSYVSEPYFIRIESVDRKRLDRPVEFPARDVSPFIAKEVVDRRVGDRYRCFGYETGGFEGPPSRLFDFVPAFATTPSYQFRTQFVEVKQVK